MARRSTTERGYGAAHKREKARWARILKAEGALLCATAGKHKDCPQVIRDGDQWDLGHTPDRTAYLGPQCIPCNRGDGGRNGAAVTNSRIGRVVRDW